MWVPKKDCQSIGADTENCESGKNLFDPLKSKSANMTDQRFNIYYGTGSVSGTVYQDYLSVSLYDQTHINLLNDAS